MICKNCGKEVAEGSAFCTECGAPLARQEAPVAAPAAPEAPVYAAPAAPETPVYAAPAAPAVPEAPVYAAPAAPAAPVYAQPYAAPVQPQQPAPAKQPAPKPVKEKKPGKGGKIALIVTVAGLALALIAGGVFGYLLYKEKTRDIKVLETENETLTEQLKDYQTLSDNYDALAEDYNDLSAKYDALNGTHDTLSKDHDKLSADYEELKTAYDALAEEEAAMQETYDFYTKFAVVCSDQNKYYHTYDCEDWDRSAFWIYNLEAAKGKEFTACPKCHPGE